MDSIALIPLVAFILLLAGVLLRDSSNPEKPPEYANRGHRRGCPWCGHYLPCDRLDCPVEASKRD